MIAAELIANTNAFPSTHYNAFSGINQKLCSVPAIVQLHDIDAHFLSDALNNAHLVSIGNHKQAKCLIYFPAYASTSCKLHINDPAFRLTLKRETTVRVRTAGCEVGNCETTVYKQIRTPPSSPVLYILG